MATRTTIPNWSPLTRHVQNDIPDSSQFVDSKTVLIAAGPPKISSTSNLRGTALPIGVMENIAVQQSKTVQRIFEIGSLLSYFVPGRMIGQVSFGRSLYNGASLLKALYNASADDAPGSFRAFAGGPNSRQLRIKSPPGVGDFFGNLGSDLFNHPFGLLLAIIDNNLDPYGGIYLQDCHIQGHQFSVNSQSTVLVEGASAQFDIAIPVNIAAGILAQRQDAGFIANL